MTIKVKATLGAALMVVIALLVSIGFAHANPSYLFATSTATATSSPTFMTAGTATTTLTFDAGASSGAGTTDSATLSIYLTASSTNTTLNWFYEYSQDGISWFRDNLGDAATTSPIYSATTGKSYTWVYASTTVGGIGLAANTITGSKIVSVPTPVRYVRAVFALPAGSTNGAVWAEIRGKRQSQ